jgi:hypothetical protein
MKYRGSCHCGRVAFEAEGTIERVMSCNCSICQRKGSLLWFIPKEKFRLLTPEANAGTYTFNKHRIKHRFCTVCGMQPYAEAIDPKGVPTAAINVRCVEDVELASIPVTHFDGRSI